MGNVKLNLKVRMRNKVFWVAFIPAALMLAQTVCNTFGIEVDFLKKQGDLMNLVDSAFVLLAILGIVVDPTTEGVSDSKSAMEYEEPKKGGD